MANPYPILLAQLQLNVKQLGEDLNTKITTGSGGSGDPKDLAQGIMGALNDWLGGSVFTIAIAAMIFVTTLFVFYGAFLYFTAYGDENRATQAKKTITYAFIGFAIAASSFGIANYVKRIIITERYEKSRERAGGAPAAPLQAPGVPVGSGEHGEATAGEFIEDIEGRTHWGP